MRTFCILFQKELRSFFLSPLAWIVMALFTFLNGWLFASMVNAMRLRVSARSLVYNLFDSGWFWMAFFICFMWFMTQTSCAAVRTAAKTRW